MRRCALLVLALVTVACTSSKQNAASDTTAVPDTSTTATSVPASSTTSTSAKPTTTTTGVPRTTVTTLLTLGPGAASLTGTVTGPQGPVDGATVHVERLVGKAVAATDVTTSGGSWQLQSILGGSYRVRAFKAPDLAPSPVEAFFLAANERKVVDFTLAAAGGDRITAVVNPSPPRVDQPATLTITVGIGRVDDQGRPAITPRPGVALTLTSGSGYAVESTPQLLTDGNGAASWRIRCVTEGATSIALTVGAGGTSVNLPACGPPVPPPATTTTRAA